MIAIGKHVLVRPDTAPERVGSIIIPESAKKRPPSGAVAKIGEAVESPLRPGDTVTYNAGAGVLMENGLLGLLEDDILFKQ
jgi:co-chaperonin GroES (HSP10)